MNREEPPPRNDRLVDVLCVCGTVSRRPQLVKPPREARCGVCRRDLRGKADGWHEGKAEEAP